MGYMIYDPQVGSYLTNSHVFKTKKEVYEHLRDFHGVDYGSKFLKTLTDKQLLEFGDWEIIKTSEKCDCPACKKK